MSTFLQLLLSDRKLLHVPARKKNLVMSSRCSVVGSPQEAVTDDSTAQIAGAL